MDARRYPWILGVGAAALAAGCAQLPLSKVEAPAAATKVTGVYRVQQPAGTAAGQYAVGRIDLAEGRVDAAIARFRQALQLDPAFLEAHNGLGVAHGQQGRYTEAVAAFRAALAVSPDAPHVLSNLGFAQLKAGQLEDAAVSLSRSLSLDSRNERTRENLALLQAARTAVAAALAAPAQPSGELSAAPTGGPAVTEMAPKAVAVVTPLKAPTLSAKPAFEVVLARTNESALVQVAPNVYELRSEGPTIGAAQPVADPGSSNESPPQPQVLRVAEPVRPLQSPEPEPAAFLAPPSFAAKRPAVTVSLAKLDGLEVSNGVGIRHLAGRTARSLSRLGVTVTRVSDYRLFGRQRTEIHYRAGHESEAMTVRTTLPVGARLVRSERLHPSVNVRLVIGRDLVARQVAWLGEEGMTADSGAENALYAQQAGSNAWVVASALSRTDLDAGWRLL